MGKGKGRLRPAHGVAVRHRMPRLIYGDILRKAACGVAILGYDHALFYAAAKVIICRPGHLITRLAYGHQLYLMGQADGAEGCLYCVVWHRPVNGFFYDEMCIVKYVHIKSPHAGVLIYYIFVYYNKITERGATFLWRCPSNIQKTAIRRIFLL